MRLMMGVLGHRDYERGGWEGEVDRKIKGQKITVPSLHNERIFPRHRLLRHYRLPPRREPPSSRPKRLVQYPPILDFW